MPKGPPTKGRRFLKLAGMTAKVAGKSAGQKLASLVGKGTDAKSQAEHHAWTGNQIAQTLGELKGAAMKVGQMAAATWDLLPTEMADALRVLQKDVPAAPYAQIVEQVESQLGKAPSELFAQFERTPIGTASIGQVHRARTHDGQDIVVKVQHQGIDGAVDSDLAQLRRLAKIKGWVLDKAALDEAFDEVRARMLEELDYAHEASQCQAFGDLFANDPQVIVPRLIPEFCTGKVVTTSFEPSDPLDRICELEYDQDTRNKIGTRLFSLLWEQLFVHRRMHADPHPGNFGARPDGSLVIYDYGCIKTVPETFLTPYKELVTAAFVNDYERVEQALRGLGVRKLEGPNVPFDYYRSWRDIGLKPFLDYPMYDFAKSGIHEAVMKKAPQAIKYVPSFKPARDLLFVDRTLFGHYGNLRAIKAQVPCFEILATHLPEILNARGGR